MGARVKYKIFLYTILFAGCFAVIYMTAVYFDKNIPDSIIIHENNEKVIDFNIPFTGVIESSSGNGHVKALNLNEPVIIKTGSKGTYNMDIKLFGLITYKNVEIDVVDKKYVYACGNTIGLYLKSDGVMVIDTGSFSSDNSMVCPSKDIIKSGDYITAVNGTPVTLKSDLISLISNCGGNDVVLTIRRNDSVFDVKVLPCMDETGTYKLGLWVKDDCQGIGTLTYLDENGRFGALGHGICDSDTGKIVEISGGVLYNAKVLSVIKGEAGTPGEYVGTIDYSTQNILGFIDINSPLGIYGISDGTIDYETRVSEVGYMYDVALGKATILTSVDGAVEEYEIMITELDYSSTGNKGIVFEVTDEKLLEKTNGIVQGQSGSPILQNGKLVGAVTHVFVNNSKMGYGIFLETMLRNQSK